jgi:hypothetical protein
MDGQPLRLPDQDDALSGDLMADPQPETWPPALRFPLSEAARSIAFMTSIEDRVGMLEMRADRLETWSGPGQAEAFALSQQQLRADLAGIRRTQDRHSRTLAVLTSDMAVLKTDVAVLKTDVAVLKTDVAVLKTDVAVLKTDVAQLRSDMAEVKGMVQQILARLPER